ncbi:hypothetical protein CYMTET_6736 [Cymbomonas tetramitiformis]|uniref:Uncharacterized protein n=1 Tax=Cymbomonas tetramitiformis TaxID=36881 RepID=A0AAE0GWZ2_9CHLO|nr:hypothetical protein CYMTET_6736 [Cymbomonas tetramitiformis]
MRGLTCHVRRCRVDDALRWYAMSYESEGADPAKKNALYKEAQALENLLNKDKIYVAPVDEGSSIRLDNIPLFRANWAFLPGYSDMLAIHKPRALILFRELIHSPRPWFFVHVFRGT